MVETAWRKKDLAGAPASGLVTLAGGQRALRYARKTECSGCRRARSDSETVRTAITMRNSASSLDGPERGGDAFC